ncbi:MAG TPA: Nascent polypeptide-associated complex protein [Pyrodictium sp.]|nr:Nascent polypeptide-associated complex protein [Pyrodictium sp.]
MGINIEFEEVKAVRVIVEREDGGQLVFEEPDNVILFKMPGNATILQVMGKPKLVEAKAGKEEEKPEFTEEDVKLVAEQAGVSLEEARRALEETGGDIAAAIILLEERKKS